MKISERVNSFISKKITPVMFFVALLFGVFSNGQNTYGQDPNWNSFLTITAYPSPYLSQWERDPSMGTLTLNYNGTAPVEFNFSVEITNPTYGTVISGTTPGFTFDFGPTSRVFTFQDVVDWNNVDINNSVEQLIQQTGMLPEGDYEACVQTFSKDKKLLTESCYGFEIIQPDPPQLVSPVKEEILFTVHPTFMWDKVNVPIYFTDYYLLKIVEVLEGQTLYRAMEGNIPVFEDKIKQMNSLVYPVDAYPLEMNKTYAWQVQAMDEEGAPITKNMGKSDIWMFSLGSGSGEFALEKLILVDNLAYLTDMQNLSVSDDGATITLDGSAFITLLFSDGSSGRIPVSVKSLVLQKDSYDAPIFLGGNIVGDIVGKDIFPKSMVGDFFTPTYIEFNYKDFLKIKGGFFVQGNTLIPLDGEINLDSFGMLGSVGAIADPGVSLFTFGDETVGLGITEIALNFPSTELHLSVNAFLFNQLSDCAISEVDVDKDGELSVDFNCDISTQFSLLGGSNLFVLGIDYFGGKFLTNLFRAGKDNYEIDIKGKTVFNFNPENLFGAEVEFNLTPGKFELTDFRPFGDYETSNVDLGWVNFLIEDLKLDKLEYLNGNWDFKITMGANFFFPDFFDMPLPRLKGVSFTPQGFSFPMMKLSGTGIDPINFDGFELTLDQVRSQPFDFDLASWTPGSIANMDFEFDVLFNMPNFPVGSDDQFSNLNLDLTANFNSGNFSLDIPDFTFPNSGAAFPLGGGINFNVEKLLGELKTEFDGLVMNFLPDIKIKGKMDLPEAFACDDGNPAFVNVSTSINVNGNGLITGEAHNIIPACPLDLGFVTLQINESSLEFKKEGSQKAYLDGTGILDFDSPNGKPILAKIHFRYEIIEGKLILLEGVIDEPFLLTLIPDYPALRFEINRAEIKDNRLKIDGRHKILFDDGNFIGATFDQFELSFEDLSVNTGSITFDSPFAFMITGIEDFDIEYQAVEMGTPIKDGVSAIYLELPEIFGFDQRGLFAEGKAKAKMVYQGDEFEDLDIQFINNFALNFSSPLHVVEGQCDIYYDNTKIAYINRDGFFPDPSYFINEAIPARLPLPTEDVAYLQIKNEVTNEFIINIQETGATLEYSTFDGQPVPLVFPSLQQGKPTPPQLPTEFNLTVSKTTGLIKSGFISVTVPEDLRADFDLSDRGIPFEIHSIFYGNIGGVYAFRFTGVPKIFGEEAVCSDSTVLTFYSDGRMEGNLNCDLNLEIPIVEGSDKLNLFVNNFNGEFLINLLTPNIQFDFEIDANLKLKLPEGHDYNPWILLGYTQRGVEIRDYDLDTLGVGIIPISPSLEIGISNLSVPTLDWSSSNPGSGWDFEFGMDVLIRFPEFDNLTIPGLNGITLDNDGFHFPNITLPDLGSLGGEGSADGDGLRFEFYDFGLTPLAFRMPAFNMNWFSPDGGDGDWDFGFDFEIDFPNLGDDASDGMRFPEITMLDAHFTGGLIFGDIEYTEFSLPGLRFGLGGDFGLGFNTLGISGGFFDNGGSQGINFNIDGNLQLPTFMQCDDGNGVVNLAATTFSFNSRGLIEGHVERFVPECPIDLGFGIFRVTGSTLDFSIQENAQSAIMNMTGELEIPAGEDLTVTALGSLTMDLITGEILDGEIRIDQEFIWSIPFDNPVLSFRIQSAVLNGDGFAINGQSQLLLDGGSQIPVRFENFLFDLQNQRVKSGRLVIDESFAFKMKLENGGIDWSVIPYDEPLTEADGNAAKIGMASTMILDADGMAIEGEAIAEIRWLEDYYNALRIEYNGGFLIGVNPFAVVEGEADIYLESEGGGESRVAYLDRDGFHLGDIFELLELPERIPLPELDIAYLQIKNGDNVLVETESVGENMRIFTRNNEPVNFVAPSLQYSNGTPPAFDVEFSIVVNPTTFQIISGNVIVIPGEGETSIINLRSFGIPVDLTEIRYAQNPANGAYRLTADGRLDLPDILSEMPLNLEDLEFDNEGLRGEFNMGQFSRLYVNVSTIAETVLGETSAITLEGLLGDFDGSHFGFSGKFIPKLFSLDGDTSSVHYAAEWNGNSRSFEFSFDFQNGEKWNLGIAEFEPKEFRGNPPISLTVSENDFQFVLNGVLTSDLFGDEFILPFENFTISKNHVAASPISRNRANAFELELFKAKFKIFDVDGVSAVVIEFENNILRLILSGDVQFFGLDPIVFKRFSVGTDGEFSIEGLDFLSDDEDNLPIVDDMIVLKRIHLDGNKLSFDGWVKLPAPADENMNPFGFSIFPDGSIDGSTEIVFLDQPRELGNGDESEYSFWEAVLDPTYLSLNLDLGDFANSSVRMVGDIYFNNNFNKRIEIGDNSGGTLTPGMEIFFNGNFQWKNVHSVGTFPIIDWETFKLNLTDMSIPDGSNVFLLTLSGDFELDLEVAGGGLEFTDFRILADGTVDRFNESITGGSFSILDVITITVTDVGYSPVPTTITIESGTMPTNGSNPSDEEATFDVESYIQFGGSIDIVGVVSGGVEKFLSFKSNGRNQFLVKRAELDVPGMNLIADFQYFRKNANSYYLLFGGSGDFSGQEIIVVGQVGNINGRSSFGMFVAVPTVIPIGPVVITGLGGGFFYNPEQSLINIVKSNARVDSKFSSRIANPGSSFAVFLYGKLVLVEEHIISARVLLTVTDSRFELDGRVTLLNEPDVFEAYLHLGVGFVDFFAEGNLNVTLDMDPLIVGGTTGEGLGFYIYGSDSWGIYGSVDATILSILHNTSNFYLGSEGFLLGMETDFSFDIWIIEIGAGMEVKLWYVPNDSWGAFIKVYVKAEVLFGVAKAKGWLTGALIGAPDFYLYGSAGLEIDVLGFDWDGSVWAEISGDGVDGDFGTKPEFEQLIAEASETSNDLEQSRDNMLDRIADGQMLPVQISDAEMEAAFQTLYNWGRVFRTGAEAEREQANRFFNGIKGLELVDGYEPLNNENYKEIMAYDWTIEEVYKAWHAPAASRREGLHEFRNNADNKRTRFNEMREMLTPKLTEALEEIRPLISAEWQPSRNPILDLSFAPPVANERMQNGKKVKNIVSEPGFNRDSSIDEANKDAIAAAQEAFEEYKTTTSQMIIKINNNISKVEALLGGSEDNPGVRTVGNDYRTTHSSTENFFRQRQKYYTDEHRWAANLSVDWILGDFMNAPGFQAKAWNIFDDNALGWEIDRDISANRYAKILEISKAGQDRINDARAREINRWNLKADEYGNPNTSIDFKTWAGNESITSGLALWSHLPLNGLDSIKANAVRVLRQNVDELLDENESMFTRQAVFTSTVDSLYDVLSRLYENQYDLINEFRTVLLRRDDPDPVEQTVLNILTLLKSQIEQKFVVPTITELKVNNTDHGRYGYNQSNFSWKTSGGNVGSYEIDLRTANPQLDRHGYQNLGTSTNFNKFMLMKPGQYNFFSGKSFGDVTFYLRARNRVGYYVRRSVTYQPAFNGTGDGRNVSSPPDNSPPLMNVVINYPEYTLSQNEFGTYYTTNATSIAAEWEASDPGSGIQEYKYAIGTSNDDKHSVLDWTSNGGRNNVVIQGLNLHHNYRYKLFVKAKNGSGVWSDETICAGVLQKIIIDKTPPTKPGIIIELPGGFGGAWTPPGGGYPPPVTVNPPVPLPYVLRGKTTLQHPALRNYGARISAAWRESEDPESGIRRYEYKLTNANNPSQATDWINAEGNLDVTFHSDIMNFLDSFYVDIRSINGAVNESEYLRYMKRPVDSSIPSKPDVAMATTNSGRGVYLVFDGIAIDYQSGVDYYEVTMGTTPGGSDLISAADQARFKLSDLNSSDAYYLGSNLPSAAQSYFTIRAVNGQGKKSAKCVTGPFIQDITPPIRPKVNPAIGVHLEQMFLELTYSNISDPESGISNIQIKIIKQGDQPSTGEWTNVGVVNRTVMLLNQDFPVRLNKKGETEIAIGIRTVNGFGLISKENWTMFTIPSN